jgi:hypothetical protein
MPNYLDFSIKTRNQFKEYILMSLGAPLHTIELTDGQLDLCINNSVELFSRYMNMRMEFLVIDLNQYEEGKGFKLPDNVLAIQSLDNAAIDQGGHTTLFTLENAMWNMGQWPDFSRMITQGGAAFVSYELAMQYLDLVKMYRGKGFDFDYNPRDKYLKLYPDPKVREFSGYMVVSAFIMPKEEEMYGEDWVKRCAVAEAKILLGMIRSKFNNVQLLGGGQIDGTSLRTEGISERDALIADLRVRESPVMGFYVG